MSVIDFFQGHYRYLKDKFFGSPEYLKEQIIYRLDQCKDDCVPTGHCKYCGCPTEKKVWATSSCNNQERFPDLMHYEQWQNYKNERGIDIKLPESESERPRV